jgi:hypothetical protein
MREEIAKLARIAGRYYAARRRVVTVACAVCGAPTRGTVLRRYCSPRCQMRASRARARARRQPVPLDTGCGAGGSADS